MQVTIIKKGKIDAFGYQPLQVCLFNGKRKYFPTYIKVLPNQFKKGLVVNHPDAEEFNRILEQKAMEAYAEAAKRLNPQLSNPTLSEFYKEQVEQLERSADTIKQYEVQLGKVEKYQPGVLVRDITPKWLAKFKVWLREEKKYNGETISGNTVWNGFKFLKNFITRATDQGLLSKNPFDQFEAPNYRPPIPEYLTEVEINDIDRLVTSGRLTGLERSCANWFLIVCYTGMRISDMMAFKRESCIRGNRLTFETIKGATLVGIPIGRRLRELLERVDYTAFAYTEKTFRTALKVIANLAGITINLKPHVGRHTAAMMFADGGIPIEVAQAILGHKDIRSTQVYYRISNKRVDNELQKIPGYQLDVFVLPGTRSCSWLTPAQICRPCDTSASTASGIVIKPMAFMPQHISESA